MSYSLGLTIKICLEFSQKLFTVKGKKKVFDHSHCGQIQPKCLVLMLRQWCLYQCDPYLEPWIVNQTKPETTTAAYTTTTVRTTSEYTTNRTKNFTNDDYFDLVII